MSNVRVLISLADLTAADARGLTNDKDLMNSTHTIYQLPWDRKYLLSVAEALLKGTLWVNCKVISQ